MEYDNANKGAVWLRTSKNGLKYMSGNLDVNGTEYDIAMFKNDKKGNDKAPDYRLTIKTKEEQAPHLSQGEIVASAVNEERDPFKVFAEENPIDENLLPF